MSNSKKISKATIAALILGPFIAVLLKSCAEDWAFHFEGPIKCVFVEGAEVCLDEYYRVPKNCFFPKSDDLKTGCQALLNLSERNKKEFQFTLFGHFVEVTKIRGSGKHMIEAEREERINEMRFSPSNDK